MENLPEVKGTSRDFAAAKVGMSGKTMGRGREMDSSFLRSRIATDREVRENHFVVSLSCVQLEI